MTFQKIFVVGAGAIGSCYGALLSAKNYVTLVGSRAHVQAINSHGLTLNGDSAGKYWVRAATGISHIPGDALVILATKAQDVAQAAGSLKPLLRSDTLLLALQNGLGIKELVQGAVGGKADVVRGLTMMGAEFFEAGAVTLWEGPTVIEGTEAGGKIKTLFEESGLEARIASDIRMDEWVKFTTNCVVNPLTAILRVRDNEIGTPLLSEIRHGIVQECSLVAEAEGIHLGDGLEGQIDRKIKGYTNYSSMYQDIAKGKGTEIDFLNGKVVELGRKHSIRTPSNEALADLIKFLEAKK